VPFDSWRDGRDVLAGHLSFEEWAATSIAARQALLVVHQAPLSPTAGLAITASERAVMETMVPDIARGGTRS
jgi:hypothetical protein